VWPCDSSGRGAGHPQDLGTGLPGPQAEQRAPRPGPPQRGGRLGPAAGPGLGPLAPGQPDAEDLVRGDQAPAITRERCINLCPGRRQAAQLGTEDLVRRNLAQAPAGARAPLPAPAGG
jgi:hypothetical protein